MALSQAAGTDSGEQTTDYGVSGNNHTPQAIYRHLKQMRSDGELTDVFLIAKHGYGLRAHRVVLAAASAYFRRGFVTALRERNRRILILPEIEYETLQMIVDFSYGKRLPFLKTDDVIELIKWADYFQMPELIDVCTQKIMNKVTVENFTHFVQVAARYNIAPLSNSIYRFTCRNFGQIYDREEVSRTLTFEQLHQVLQSSRTNVADEKMVWKAIWRWVNRDLATRKQHFKQLLMTVRLTLLDDATFDQVRNSDLVQQDDEVKRFVSSAYALKQGLPITSNRLVPLLQCKACCARLPYEVVIATGGWVSRTATEVMEIYDPRVNAWQMLDFGNENDVVDCRAYHGSAVVDHQLYSIGGINGNQFYNVVRRFDFDRKLWTDVASMTEKRCYVSVAKHQAMIYAFGGLNGIRRLKTAESYFPQTNQWTLIHQMDKRRSDGAATTLADKIFVLGGFNGFHCMKSGECYDVYTDRWTRIQPMAWQRAGFGAVTVDNCVYALGGFDGLYRSRAVERYDPRIGSWYNVTPMFTCRSNFGLAVIENRIMVAGGYNGVTTTAQCEAYDPRMDRWSKLPPLSISRSALSCAVVRDLPNIEDFVDPCRISVSIQRQHRRPLLLLP